MAIEGVVLGPGEGRRFCTSLSHGTVKVESGSADFSVFESEPRVARVMVIGSPPVSEELGRAASGGSPDPTGLAGVYARFDSDLRSQPASDGS